MTVFLDYEQRLNLTALVGAQKGPLAELRQLWKLLDRIELSEEEKVAVNFRVAVQNGLEYFLWNRRKSEPRAFELTEAEVQRLRKLIEEWPQFIAGSDRSWIETTVEQLDSLAPKVVTQ
jgi:hypothetical protein